MRPANAARNSKVGYSKILTINQHDSIILAVANRSVDAAAVASYVFDNYDRRITEKTRILAKSAAIPLGQSRYGFRDFPGFIAACLSLRTAIHDECDFVLIRSAQKNESSRKNNGSE